MGKRVLILHRLRGLSTKNANVLRVTLTARARGLAEADSGARLIGIALAMTYAVLVCANGIPALRHDWVWPRERFAFLDLIVNSTTGWSTTGIGSPAPYPSGYIAGTVIGVAGLIFGPLVTLALFVFAIGASIALGARALAKTLDASPIQTITIEIFALFNPWTYNKTVAGHTYMLLAYGACLAILAELLRADVRKRRLSLLLILVLPQLQFFIMAMIAITIYALMRRVYLPLVTGLIIGLPICVGLVFDRSSLLHIPYTLAWEVSQSVDPGSAPVLAGYFTRYAEHFNGVQIGAVWAIVACACVAAISTRRRMLAALCVVIIALFLIAAMGTRGPLGSSYAGIVLRFPESGLFRELYDLLVFVTIGYCVLLACLPGAGGFRPLGLIALVASLVMASAWFTWPPFRYWIDLAQVPFVKIATTPNTRFALYPAYQPMLFNGKGSGVDPDAYARPRNVTPLNEYLAQYPANVALSAFKIYGDAHPLSALSVSLIVQRPWLSTNTQSIRFQLNGVPLNRSTTALTEQHVEPVSEVTLNDYPRVGSLVNVLGSGNIFFADARTASFPGAAEWRSMPAFMPAQASNAFVDEAKGWTDVRFDFASEPQIGQGLGGAVTTNADALLPVHGALTTLVDVVGMLRSQDGRVVSHATCGYRWVQLAASVTGVRCSGRCVVVGQEASQRIPPLNPPPRFFRRIEFSVMTPWFVRVQVPPGSLPVLRYNVAYDPNWLATSGVRPLAHLRLDATVNGWLLERRSKPYTVYVVHRAALAQALAELLGSVWILMLALRRPATGANP